MKWLHVDDALPLCPKDRHGRYQPTLVFIFAATTGRYGLAWYAPRRRPHPWLFWHGTTAESPDPWARRTFREGRIISHWATPTRPGPAKVRAPKGGAP